MMAAVRRMGGPEDEFSYFRQMEGPEDYSKHLSQDAFTKLYEAAMGGFWQKYPNSRESFCKTLYGALAYPTSADAAGKTIKNSSETTVPEADVKKFEALASSLNACFGAEIVQTYSYPSIGSPGKFVVGLYADSSLPPKTIQDAFTAASDPAKLGENLAKITPVEPGGSTIGGSSIPKNAVPKKPDAQPEEESGVRDWKLSPYAYYNWRYYVAAFAEVVIKGFEKSFLLPNFVPLPSELENIRKPFREYLRGMDNDVKTLSIPDFTLIGRASMERKLTQQQRIVAGTEEFLKFYGRNLLPIFQAQAQNMWGVNLTGLGAMTFEQQLKILSTPPRKGRARGFAIAPNENGRLERALIFEFGVSSEDAKNILAYYVFAANDLRSGGIRAVTQATTMDEFPDLKEKFKSASGTKKLKIDYVATLHGTQTGPFQIQLGDYFAPGCGEEGEKVYKEQQRTLAQRLFDPYVAIIKPKDKRLDLSSREYDASFASLAAAAKRETQENARIPDMPFSELQRQLQNGGIMAGTNYLEWIKLGILHYDDAAKAATITPYNYAWFANGKWNHSETKPYGVSESALTGGIYGYWKIISTRLSGKSMPIEKGRLLDETLFSDDRKVGAEFTERSHIQVVPRFIKPAPSAPLFDPQKGFEFTSDLKFLSAAEGGGRIGFFAASERAKRTVTLSQVTIDAAGKETITPLAVIPYDYRDVNGSRVKTPENSLAGRTDAEFEQTQDYDPISGIWHIKEKILNPGAKDYSGTHLQVDMVLEVPDSKNPLKYARAYAGYRLYIEKPPAPPEPVQPPPPEKEKKKRVLPEVMDTHIPADPVRLSPAHGLGNMIFGISSGYADGKVVLQDSTLPFLNHVKTAVPQEDMVVYKKDPRNPDNLVRLPTYSVDYNVDGRFVPGFYYRGDTEMFFITKFATYEEMSGMEDYKQCIPCKVDSDRNVYVDWSILGSKAPPRGSDEAKLDGMWVMKLPAQEDMALRRDDTYVIRPSATAFDSPENKGKNPLLTTAFKNYAGAYTASKDKNGPFISISKGSPSRQDNDRIAVGVPDALAEYIKDLSPVLFSFWVEQTGDK